MISKQILLNCLHFKVVMNVTDAQISKICQVEPIQLLGLFTSYKPNPSHTLTHLSATVS